MPKHSLPSISTRAEAYAKGAKFYYTGKPCRKGHLAARYVSTMGCLGCLEQHKAQGAKNPYDANLVPYVPRNVWRSASWDYETLERAHEAVQETLRTFEPAKPSVAAPVGFKKLYGVHHWISGTAVDLAEKTHELWATRDGRPRTQLRVKLRGGDTVDLFHREALDGTPWVYIDERWYVCRDINYELYPVIAMADADAWQRYGKDGTLEVPTGTP